MKLSELLSNVKTVKVIGSTDIEIKDITCNSNAVTNGGLFICLKGNDYDGHNYVKQVEHYGAVAIVCERQTQSALTQIIVENSRACMSELASAFYGNAHKELKIIGVTGTNGKTTTAHYVYNILNNAGVNAGIIGTLGVKYDNKHFETNLTTPDPLELHKIFYDMKNAGVQAVVMEVSAHALYHDKLKGISFEVGVFTNLTQDHLDFFKDMQTYKNTKKEFFTKGMCRFAVTNSDDDLGREIINVANDVISYGIQNPADVFAINVNETEDKIAFVINLFDSIYEVAIKTIGEYNVYNALGAATACALIGVKTDAIIEGINKMNAVEGRLELVKVHPYKIFIDYAHTPDGLEKSLSVLKNKTKGKLISVFGCGGNRDSEKRQIMGAVSGRIAHFTVVTTDNPRYEDPMDIIFQIEKGLIEQNAQYIIVQSREKAIEYALKLAKEGDIVLIAGKGAERYQETLGIKTPYNDKDTIENILRELNE